MRVPPDLKSRATSAFVRPISRSRWPLKLLLLNGKSLTVMLWGVAGSINEKPRGPEKIIDNKRFTCYYNVCKIRARRVGFSLGGFTV